MEFWKYFFNTDFQNKEHFEYLDSSSATKLAPAAPVEVRGAPPARPRLPGAARLGRGRGLGPRPPPNLLGKVVCKLPARKFFWNVGYWVVIRGNDEPNTT